MYQKCLRFSRMLADKGYMIITGGGPGIMQAGNEGAGSENSFAVNIRLPFEQKPNPVMYRNPRLVTYKYFFNRKVAFVKEADAVAVFPGGFGTLDEAMEVFTLVQTGKTSPKPLILVDDGDGYWESFFDFVKESLLVKGFISGEDFSLFTITKDEHEAIEVIDTFYRTYHSLRFIENRLVITAEQAACPGTDRHPGGRILGTDRERRPYPLLRPVSRRAGRTGPGGAAAHLVSLRPPSLRAPDGVHPPHQHLLTAVHDGIAPPSFIDKTPALPV